MTGQKPSHVDSAAAVGRRIREARHRAGLGQAELAAGDCAPAYVSKIESGERTPSLQLLRQFGRRLGLSADYLATGSDDSEAELALADGQLALRLGDEAAARSVFEKLVSSKEADIRCAAELGLARLASSHGDPITVIELLEPAVQDQARPGELDPEVIELLVRAYLRRGERPQALALVEQEAKARIGEPVALFRLNVVLANLLIDLGEFNRAETILATTLESMPTPGDSIALARCLWSQSRLHTAQGGSDAALRYADEALALIRATEHDEYAARAFHLVAYIELDRGEATRALELIDLAEPILERMGDESQIAALQLDRARALAAAGRSEEAQALAEDLLVRVDHLSPVDAARALGVIADITAASGSTDRALELYETAANAIADIESSPMLVDLYTRWSDLLAETGDVELALQVARRALTARAATKPS